MWQGLRSEFVLECGHGERAGARRGADMDAGG